MPQGQTTWESRGYASNEYVVEVETQKNIAKEYRFRSNFGRLAKPMKTLTVGQGQQAQDIDIASSACIWSKEIKTGDECRFTLEQNMTGAPTFGDAEVRVGEYLAYLQQNIILNKIDTPVVPVIGEMSAQRIKDVIGDPEGRIRNEITMYLAEQYVYDILEAHFRGASRTLMAPRADGGRALDIGLGAGVQVSPENFLCAGEGFVSGVSGTSAYETAVKAALGNLTNTAADKISRMFAHNLRAALTDKKIGPTTLAGSAPEAWYVACDPDLLTRMTLPGSDLQADRQQADKRSAQNKVFGNVAQTVEIDNMVFFPEQRLKQFRPDISGDIIWGTTNVDRREYVSSSNIALMVVLGDGAMLEGHNGSVDVTYEKGFHGKGQTIGGHVKQSFMRARWQPKDGRSAVTILNQSSMTIAFYEDGVDWTAAP